MGSPSGTELLCYLPFSNITVKGDNRNVPFKLKDIVLQSTASDQSRKKPPLHPILKGNKDFFLEEQINRFICTRKCSFKF